MNDQHGDRLMRVVVRALRPTNSAGLLIVLIQSCVKPGSLAMNLWCGGHLLLSSISDRLWPDCRRICIEKASRGDRLATTAAIVDLAGADNAVRRGLFKQEQSQKSNHVTNNAIIN